MGFFAWVLLGGTAGWTAGIITKVDRRMGLFTNVFVGSLGAVVGGWVFGLFGGKGASALDLYSLLVAVVGAVICLSVMKAVIGPPLDDAPEERNK